MIKTVKTEDILNAWKIISTAKYTKMADEDKVNIWKISRILKPIANKFEEDSKDASEKLKPYEDFTERFQKAQQYERFLRGGSEGESPITEEEYNNFIKDLQNYNRLVSNAIKEFAQKEVELEFEPLSEEAFGKLMASNDWTIEQAMGLSPIIL